MHGTASCDHDAKNQKVSNSGYRLKFRRPCRYLSLSVCASFVFIVGIVFSFNGSIRIHATDPIHWIAFSICPPISNVYKTHKFSSASWYLRTIQLDIRIETIENCTRRLWHTPNVRIPHTALQKSKQNNDYMALALVFFLFAKFSCATITLQLFAKFSHFSSIHLWLRWFFLFPSVSLDLLNKHLLSISIN